MKKAKVMLMAIGILAVVGGALAFKAAKLQAFPYAVCDVNAPNGPVCTLNKVMLLSTTVQSGGNLVQSAIYGQPCVIVGGHQTACSTRLIANP